MSDVCKVVAIVRCTKLDQVMRRLTAASVPGVTVWDVRGFGEYVEYAARDLMSEHARIEVYANRSDAAAVRDLILQSARCDAAGDGLVAIEPVDALYRTRSGERIGGADVG